jgi:hypothetical protein
MLTHTIVGRKIRGTIMNQKIAIILIAAALITTCGCVGSKPVHDFEINEMRHFDFVYDDIHYGGNLMWDGEHFHIAAVGYGEKEGFFVTTHINGIDNDAVFQISSPESGLPSHVDRHVDFSRTVLLNEMIKNRVNKTGINDSR